jgi:membrane protein implicated in regulation of membrane protease activity
MAWIYIVLGVVTMVLELVVPGGVTFCLGLASLMTGGMVYLGWIDTVPMSFMACCMMAVTFVIPMQFLLKGISDGDTSKANIDEDVDCFGQVVRVAKPIGEDNDDGRISFQGTEWPACSHGGQIAAGQLAKIIGRENLVWVVEAVSELEA